MHHSKLYIFLIVPVFLILLAVFTLLPRSEYSELERRELATFPSFGFDKLQDGTFAKELASWFGDTEAYRDEFMTANMVIKEKMGMPSPSSDEGAIKFHGPNNSPATAEANPSPIPAPKEDEEMHKYENKLTAAEENAKMADAGILVIGETPNARALMAYGGSSTSGTGYAEAANKYKETFGDAVNVYCMAIPSSIEYYCPDKAKKVTNSQFATIKNIHEHLADNVKPVDVYTILGKHANEPIYLRTDHHWAPLGAYYAAKQFAHVAGVPFKDISTYEKRVVHDFVGTMYGYSKDIAVKKSPEDFEYYVPTGVDYTTTYINFNLDKNYQIESESKPYTDKFFYKFKDGSGMAYSTFMGSDMKLTHVNTSTKNGRRLIILKDSFGNAIPGYLFHSFEDIYVIDCRYFNRNMTDFVKDNKITDILFANGIFKCCSTSLPKTYIRFLTQ